MGGSWWPDLALVLDWLAARSRPQACRLIGQTASERERDSTVCGGPNGGR